MNFKFIHENLSDSSIASNYLPILCAAIMIEFILIINYRAFPNYWGNVINNMYTEFTLTIVVIDILALLIAFSFSQVLYEYLFGSSNWSIALFMLIMMFYQVYRNLFYFYIVPFFVSIGTNKLYDKLIVYKSTNIKNMALGNLFIAIIFPIITAIFKNMSISFQINMIIFILFLICYMLLNYPPNKGEGIKLDVIANTELQIQKIKDKATSTVENVYRTINM
jgi:hypothetical protein